MPHGDVAGLRRLGRERAALRPPGPAMPVHDSTIDGVRIRRYEQRGADLIVFAHGGGFVLGDLDTHDAFTRRIAAATGRTVVAVDYRRAPEHPFPAALDDVRTVLDAALGMAPGGRVAVAGDSAGGFLMILAALALALAGRERVDAQLLVCPVADVTLPASQPSVVEKGTGYNLDAAELREWIGWWAPDTAPNPLAGDLTGMPAALVVTSEHDPLRDGGDQYARRLQDAGVPVVHRTEPGLEHNFAQSAHASPACADADARWLRDAAELLR